jgi:uncharacterized protein
MKITPFFLVLVACSCSAFAAPPTIESIEALLVATKAEKLADGVYADMETNMRKAMKASSNGQALTPQQQRVADTLPAKLIAIIRDELSWSQMLPLYVKLYQETFTQEEIDSLIAFYKTPVGISYTDKLPVLTQKTMSAIQERLAPLMKRTQALTKETMEEAKAAK